MRNRKRHQHWIVISILTLVLGAQNSPVHSMWNKSPDAALVGSAEESCATVLFSDDFSDGNADGWTTELDGTWFVDNYSYVVDIGVDPNLGGRSLAGNTAWTDYTFDLDLRAEEGASKIILFRYIDEDNYYSVGVIGLELPYLEWYKVNLVMVENGEGETVLEVDYPHDNYAWHHVKVIAQGNHIIAYVDEDLVYEYTDFGSTITHGKIGLVGYTGSIGGRNKVRFDNVRVQQLCLVYLPLVEK